MPVQREEVRVEREPIEGDVPTEIGDGEQEVTLNQEEAVVEQTSRRGQTSD